MIDPVSQVAWLRHEDGQRTAVARICTIGRSSTNHLVLPESKVSRRHAIVHAQESGEYWLVDLGSSNGTFLNGQRVTSPARLKDGDEVRISGFGLRFRQPEHGDANLGWQSSGELTAREIEGFDAWLLVADIQGSTKLNRECSPEEAAARITEWFGACRDAIEAHRGTLDKYLGDGFLAYWLAESVSASDITSALEALKTYRQGSCLPFRIAIHRGFVSFGHVPAMGRARLFGPEVNFAFRMERLAKQLDAVCLLSEPAFRSLPDSVAGEALGSHELPGFDGSFHLYRC